MFDPKMILDGSLRHDADLPWWNQINLCKSDIERFWGKVMVPYNDDGTVDYDSCWMFDSSVKTKYPQFALKGHIIRCNRIMFEVCNGVIESNMVICHKCDTPRCVNPTHLWKGTQQQNVIDRDLKGRNVKGINVNTAKLSVANVKDILTGIYFDKYKTTLEILEVYDIAMHTLYMLLRGNTWKDITHDICTELGCTLSTLKIKIVDSVIKRRNSRFTVLEAIEIRVRLKLGETPKSLANEFKVDRHTISDVKLRKTYNIIPNEKLLTEQYITSLNITNPLIITSLFS